MTELAEGTNEILSFWFDEIGPDHWWTHSESIDSAVRTRFEPLLDEWHVRPVEDFLGGPRETLAAVILFDQFPRHMYRGQARAFATDGLALALTKGARDRGYDADLDKEQRSMLFMPFMHSEDLIDQDRSVDLFSEIGGDSYDYAARHRRIIEAFGRFPARNAALGRADRPEEAEAIAASSDW